MQVEWGSEQASESMMWMQKMGISSVILVLEIDSSRSLDGQWWLNSLSRKNHAQLQFHKPEQKRMKSNADDAAAAACDLFSLFFHRPLSILFFLPIFSPLSIIHSREIRSEMLAVYIESSRLLHTNRERARRNDLIVCVSIYFRASLCASQLGADPRRDRALIGCSLWNVGVCRVVAPWTSAWEGKRSEKSIPHVWLCVWHNAIIDKAASCFEVCESRVRTK
jgi:hypothetical protein